MTIYFDSHQLKTDTSNIIGGDTGTFTGRPVVSDISQSGTNTVSNIVVLSASAYSGLTPDSHTLYFLT